MPCHYRFRPFVLLIDFWYFGAVIHEPTGPTPDSHFEHSSIPATVKKLFNLKSNFLTKRDAWAGTFENYFYLRSTPRDDCPGMHRSLWYFIFFLMSNALAYYKKSCAFSLELFFPFLFSCTNQSMLIHIPWLQKLFQRWLCHWGLGDHEKMWASRNFKLSWSSLHPSSMVIMFSTLTHISAKAWEWLKPTDMQRMLLRGSWKLDELHLKPEPTSLQSLRWDLPSLAELICKVMAPPTYKLNDYTSKIAAVNRS